MPFLTNDPLPQCLQHNSATGGLLGRDHARGCRRYLLKVKCLLILNGSTADQSGIAKWRQTSAEVYRDSAYKQLLDVSSEGEVHFGIPPVHALKRGIYKIIIGPSIEL